MVTQIASSGTYVTVPERSEIIEAYEVRMAIEGFAGRKATRRMKPAQVIDKIVEGKLEKFFTEACLLEQPFIKDATGKTRIKDLVATATAKTGERVVVKRFARFQVGEAG